MDRGDSEARAFFQGGQNAPSGLFRRRRRDSSLHQSLGPIKQNACGIARGIPHNPPARRFGGGAVQTGKLKGAAVHPGPRDRLPASALQGFPAPLSRANRRLEIVWQARDSGPTRCPESIRPAWSARRRREPAPQFRVPKRCRAGRDFPAPRRAPAHARANRSGRESPWPAGVDQVRRRVGTVTHGHENPVTYGQRVRQRLLWVSCIDPSIHDGQIGRLSKRAGRGTEKKDERACDH